MEKSKIQGFGLKKIEHDPRDVTLGGIFKQIDITEVPNTDFLVANPYKIKDQGSTDFCTGYTVTSVSEDQEEVELCPEFQYAASCKIRGSYDEWGMDLRTAFASAVKIGSLEVSHVPKHMIDPVQNRDRAIIANWENWGEEAFLMAKLHQKGSYFKVDGRYDTFDNIRAALWQFRDEKRTIGVGAIWKDAWTYDEDGVITPVDQGGAFGHAFKVFGQKVIKGEIYLCAQLSNGDCGDNGIYYFPREVVNKEFQPFGQYMFQDLPKETAKFYQLHGIKASDSLFIQILKVVKNYIIKKITL